MDTLEKLKDSSFGDPIGEMVDVDLLADSISHGDFAILGVSIEQQRKSE